MKHLYYTAMALATLQETAQSIGHNEPTQRHLDNDPSVCYIRNTFQNAPSNAYQSGTGTLVRLDESTPPRFVITAKHIFAKEGRMDAILEPNKNVSYADFNGRRIRFKSVTHHPETDLSIIELAEDMPHIPQTTLNFERPSGLQKSRSVGTGNYRPTGYKHLFNPNIKQRMDGFYLPWSSDPLIPQGKNNFCLSVGTVEDFVLAHHITNISPWPPLPPQGIPQNTANGFVLPGDSGGKIANEQGELYAIISAHGSGLLSDQTPHLTVDTSFGLLLHRFKDWVANTIRGENSTTA